MRFEMQDRVAVGDDKYVLEELGDGRTRITPAPDSVLQEGTPINKENFQPLFDTAPIHFNLTASGVGSVPVFQDGQTVQELYEALENGRSVVITVTINEKLVLFFVPFARMTILGQVMYELSTASRFGEPTYGMYVTENKITEIAQYPAAQDMVIETGTSGDWTYRKWASGIAECWCQKTSTETVEWDNSYVVCNVDFPVLFITKPTISCSGHQRKTVSSYVTMVAGETSYASAYIKCQHEVNDEYACQFDFYVIGNWI